MGQISMEIRRRTGSALSGNQQPYAVAHPKVVVSGADILLSWIRRTRIGGELRDGTGTVPLSETVEAYEVDVLDAPGGAVLRTLTSNAASVTYPAAAITADFGAIPASLSVVINQISGVIGRGLPRAVTLAIG